MHRFNATEKLAFEIRAKQAGPASGSKMWRLYYANRKYPLYEHTNYGYCKAEIKRQLKLGIGYKKDLFKIK